MKGVKTSGPNQIIEHFTCGLGEVAGVSRLVVNNSRCSAARHTCLIERNWLVLSDRSHSVQNRVELCHTAHVRLNPDTLLLHASLHYRR